jgi:hypothetical protein
MRISEIVEVFVRNRTLGYGARLEMRGLGSVVKAVLDEGHGHHRCHTEYGNHSIGSLGLPVRAQFLLLLTEFVNATMTSHVTALSSNVFVTRTKSCQQSENPSVDLSD